MPLSLQMSPSEYKTTPEHEILDYLVCLLIFSAISQTVDFCFFLTFLIPFCFPIAGSLLIRFPYLSLQPSFVYLPWFSSYKLYKKFENLLQTCFFIKSIFVSLCLPPSPPSAPCHRSLSSSVKGAAASKIKTKPSKQPLLPSCGHQLVSRMLLQAKETGW